MLDNREVGAGGGQAGGEFSPGQFPLVVYEDGRRRTDDPFQFGRYTRASQQRIVNIEVELLPDHPQFESAFKTRRCLVPADGWYGPAGQFYCFPDANDKLGRLFYFAAIYGRGEWEGPKGWQAVTCMVIITAAACPQVYRSGSTRQPVIIQPRHYDDWLARDNSDSNGLLSMLVSRGYEGLEIQSV